MTFKQITDTLNRQAIPNPTFEALNLLEVVTKKSRSQIIINNFKLSYLQKLKLQHLIKKRETYPLAYLLGYKQFYNLNFKIKPNVLIPRPESEDLVELALRNKDTFGTIYDIGCGSGCLGISYLKNIKLERLIDAEFIDINPKAINLAKKNCRKHKLSKTKFKILDFQKISINALKPKSLIFANLPYLDIQKRVHYETNCPNLRAESPQALYTGGNGLYLYEQLFKICAYQELTIICEKLPQQGKDLNKIAFGHGFKLQKELNLASLFIKK